MTLIIICDKCGKKIKPRESHTRVSHDYGREVKHYCRKCYPMGEVKKILLWTLLGTGLFIVVVFAICLIGD